MPVGGRAEGPISQVRSYTGKFRVMTSARNASITPVTLTVNGKIGLTLWAPPWEDDDGEEWQGFLGDGAKIPMFPSAQELHDFIQTSDENDLSDHPAWPSIARLSVEQLRPGGDDAYDLDEVYVWAAGEPDPIHVSALANVVDMVAQIADCCDDGALRSLLSSAVYEELVDDDVSYQGRDGRKRWTELGDLIADSWERAIGRVEQWLSWQGDFENNDLEAETVWDHVGAEPIRIVLPDVTYLTVRGHGPSSDEDATASLSTDPNMRDEAEETLFLGRDGNVAVFHQIADLAEYCRTATEHDLVRLEWWSELAEVEDDAVFNPAPDATYDLTKPSEDGLDLVAELLDFCDLEADLDVLGDISNANKIDPKAWTTLITEIGTCLVPEDNG
jgi:hypothetical protein